MLKAYYVSLVRLKTDYSEKYANKRESWNIGGFKTVLTYDNKQVLLLLLL